MVPTIEPWEIISIVLAVWKKSFVRVKSNTNAISERGWFLYNQNLLTYPCFRPSVTEKEKAKEVSEASCVTLPFHKKYNVTDLITVPTVDTKLTIIPTPEETRMVNFSGSTGEFVLDKLVQHQDLMAAR